MKASIKIKNHEPVPIEKLKKRIMFSPFEKYLSLFQYIFDIPIDQLALHDPIQYSTTLYILRDILRARRRRNRDAIEVEYPLVFQLLSQRRPQPEAMEMKS